MRKAWNPIVLMAMFFVLFLFMCGSQTSGQEAWRAEILSEDSLQELGLWKKFSEFEETLISTAKELNLEQKVEAIPVFSSSNIWGVVIEGISGTGVVEISVSAQFLREKPSIIFEHATLHEVCHLKLEHPLETTSYEERVRVEDEAEKCVYNHVGEERYIDYYMEEARRKNGSAGIEARRELRRRVRAIMGKQGGFSFTRQ